MNPNFASHSRLARTAAIAMLALTALSAQATTFCVTTGTQLANALNTAASNGQNDEIRIPTGTLTGTSNPAGNPRWRYPVQASDEGHSLTLTGGWSSGNNCASQVSLDPTQTALDAQYNGRALDFTITNSIAFSGDVVVRNLTITRAGSSNQNVGVAFNWTVTGELASSLLIENVLVVASNATGTSSSAVQIEHSGGGWAKARNLIVNNNTAVAGTGLSISANGSAYAILSNASIFENTSGGAASGLYAQGVVTLANNAVADNTSSAATSYQAYSALGTSLTLRYNHFGTRRFTGGAFSDVGTTTGDAQWTQVGSIIVPDTISPLRDSGTNSPTGGLASTDFQGDARIVNSVVDRGAIEAEAIPHIGPTISAVSPTPGTGQFMPDGLTNTTVTATLTFAATGGTGAGTTSLVCTDDNAAATLSASASQVIAVGGSVTPVVVTMTYVAAGYNLAVICTANTNGTPYSFQYNFFMPNASRVGPLVVAVSPLAGSTTLLDGLVGQNATHDITLALQGGEAGGEAELQCTVLNGPVSVTANASQTLVSGGSVAPVQVSMLVTGQPQTGTVRCVASRIGLSPVTLDYTFAMNAVDAIFLDGFE